MSLSRIKTWNRNEILLSTDLNAEFNNILQNGSSLVFPLSNDLDVGSKLLINTGLQTPSQLHDAILTMDKFSNSLTVAIASIGSTKTTLLIGSAITVGADASIPDNIMLWFVGPGKLFVNATYTLTINSPSQVLAHTQQQVFDGTGTVSFTNGGVVAPGWFGFSSGGTAAANQDAYQMCVASLPTGSGGVIIIPPTGTAHQVDDSLTHGARYISVIGAHPDLSIIESTATASQKHGLIFSQSCIVKNVQVRTQAALASNYTMKGMTLDIPTVSGQTVHWENIKIRNFNIGLYLDGGASYNISQAFIKNCDIKISGPASAFVGSCINTNRMELCQYELCTLDQNNTGDHATYNFGCHNIHLKSLKIRNATTSGAQAVKLVGDGSGGGGSENFRTWLVADCDIEDCENGILLSTFGTEILDSAIVRDIHFKNVTASTGILGCVYVSTSGTSIVRNVLIDGGSLNNTDYQLAHVAAGAGTEIKNIIVSNWTAYDWSGASAGTYALVGSSGSGTIRNFHIDNIDADGNSNGRTVVYRNGHASGLNRFTWRNVQERNTVTPSIPPEDTSTSATFDFSFGNSVSVSGTRTVTAASNAVPGEIYIIKGTNNNCTFTDNAVFKLAGNWVSAADSSLVLLCLTTSTFQELSRSAS